MLIRASSSSSSPVRTPPADACALDTVLRMTPSSLRQSTWQWLIAGLAAFCVLDASAAALQSTVVVAQSSPPAATSKPLANGTPASSQVKPGNDKSSAPAWNTLTPSQQLALKPLAANWANISTAQKRKWLEVSRNFPALPAAEQTKLHSRMAEWAALSPQQRTQARLNFAHANQLSPDEKKAKWQAYQALSPDEKQRLAAYAAPKPGAAPAVKPVPSGKLAVIPTQRPVSTVLGKTTDRQVQHPSRIAVAPHQVDSNTLLPQQVQIAPAP